MCAWIILNPSPLPRSWKNCLPQKQSLLPKRLWTTDKGFIPLCAGRAARRWQQLLALLEASPNEENCPARRGYIQRWSSAGFSRSTPLNPTQDSDGLQERLLFRGLHESSSSSAQSYFHHSSATATEKHSLIKFCSNLCLGVCFPGSPIWDSHQETDFIGG